MAASLLKILLPICCGIVCACLIAAYTVPPLIPLLEDALGRALSYELLLRVYLSVIIFLTLWVGTMWAVLRGIDHAARLLLRWLWIVAAVLFAVFLSDQKWTITEENSWIRYPTAAALAGAGALLLLSLRPKTVPPLPEGRIGGEGVAPTSPDPSSGRRGIVFVLLGAGLLFAAADELFSIHEAIGAALEGAFRLPHVTTDLVTAAYGVVGLGVLIYVFRAIRALAQSSPAVCRMLALYFAGILLFIFATGFDSVDGIIFLWVRRLTDALTLRGYEFSDAWFIIWKPKLFLNALEEVFEFYAAALFAYGAWTIYRGSKSSGTETPSHSPLLRGRNRPFPLLNKEGIGEVDIPPSPPSLPSGRGGSMIALASGGLIIACVALTAATLRMPRGTPLQDGSQAVKIAGLKEGLFHTDDLDFHPRWGVVVANESEPSRRGTHTGPGVFTYKDGVFARVPDPDGLLVDIDSVAADQWGILASDGAEGKIFLYNEEGIEAAETARDGLPHPEALITHEDPISREPIITVIDESTGMIFHDAQTVFSEKPNHPLFKKPEGIIWHAGLKNFLITDDTTGVIFRYIPKTPLEIFADQSDGLRFPEDIAIGPGGKVIVTDNGAREIIVFDAVGKVLRRVRMRPLYRDLQGVTVDDEGNLYFVTADAFASESFMPSVVWQIQNFF